MSGPSPLTAPPPFAAPILARDLRLVRRAKDISLTKAAELVGVDPSYLSLIERGLRPCPPELGLKLLRLLWESA